MALMTIGEVAKEAGLRTSAIRYYEDSGLLPKAMRQRGQRRYDRGVMIRLVIIRMAQEAGFTIEEIHTLLSGFPEEMPASARWSELAKRKLPEVDARIERLRAVRAVLEESLSCGCLTLDACAEIGWRHGGSDGD
jgi:MerR family redox-sensitive transcriptional activator SoxR